MSKRIFILWLLALVLPSQAYAHGGNGWLVMADFFLVLLPALALTVPAVILSHRHKPRELGCLGWGVVVSSFLLNCFYLLGFGHSLKNRDMYAMAALCLLVHIGGPIWVALNLLKKEPKGP